MTEEQRQRALYLCDRILQTAAKLRTDLAAASNVIREEIELRHRELPPWHRSP
jgi:BMFP domain-containing protein YqiC